MIEWRWQGRKSLSAPDASNSNRPGSINNFRGEIMRKNASVTVSRVLSRDDHLSRPDVAAQVQAMPRTRRAAAYVLIRILHQMGFTARTSRQAVGELLPRLSILTAPKCGGISLLHSPWSRLHRPLAGILPCGARTFLIPLLARDRLITSHGCYHSANAAICQEGRG